MALPIGYIPYNDSAGLRYRSFPWGTSILILLNTAIHMTMWRHYIDDPIGWAQQWILYGSVSDQFQSGWGYPGVSAITSVFLHGDLFHLIFNMIALWTFGKRVEDACGTPRFIVFYLMAGLAGNWMTIFADALGFTNAGNIPGIGASGAIAGVMGAYLLLFPGMRISGIVIINVICPIPIPYRIKLPAFVFLFIFLAEQLYFSYSSVAEDISYGIGFLAHLGGFLSGLLIFLYLRKDVYVRYWTRADL